MLIRRAENTEGVTPQMDGIKGVTMRLMVGSADGAPNFAMRHFTVEPGGHTPRHEHNYEHEVYIVAGRGKAESQGTLFDISAGDALLVEANTTHQFTNTGDEPLQFLCFVPVSFDCGGEQQPTPGS